MDNHVTAVLFMTLWVVGVVGILSLPWIVSLVRSARARRREERRQQEIAYLEDLWQRR